MTMATYRESYPQTLSEGVGLISFITALDVPWSALEQSQIASLERLYGVRSGFKTVLDTFLELPVEVRPQVIVAMFKEKWTKLWNVYQLQYNPLSAYKVVENGQNTLTRDLQDSVDYGRKQEDTTTDTGTVTDRNIVSENTDDSIYGFNSDLAVNSDKSHISTDDTNTQTRDLNGTSVRQDSGTDITSKTGTETTEHDVTKEGNIGYSTPQKLLREEFQLWARPFFDTVFADIDSLITIRVY